MTKINMKSALLVGAIVLIVLAATGVSIASVFPIVFLIACPLMMLFMHGGHGKGHGSHDQSSSNLQDR